MKNQSVFKMRPVAAAGAALFALLALPAHAVTYTIVAEAVNHLMPDGVSIVPMWGYRVSAPNGDLASALLAPVTSPGAGLVVPPTDSVLSVTLHNRLAGGAPTSFVVHGLNTAMAPVFADATGALCVPGAGATDAIRRACRVRSFTAEAAANGAPVTYAYANVRPGTYLYQSGTQPQIQVQMGLYGMMSKDAAAGVVYPGVAYANQSRVLFSEVDPGMHAAVAAGSFSGSTLDYDPKHFRIHVYDAATQLPVQVDAGTVPQFIGTASPYLIRMANAGLQTRVPTLADGTWALLGEDAQPYPYAREQYSALLPAAKTTEAWLGAARTTSVFDRRMAFADSANGVAGQVLQVSTTPVIPTDLAANCPVTGTQGVLWSCLITSTTPGALLALAAGPPGMTSASTAGGLLLNWTPSNDQAQRPANPSIVNPVTVRASSASNAAQSRSFSVAVTNVNDAPTATADSFTGAAGARTLSGNVLANDADIDGDTLSATLITAPTDGTLALDTNGSFTYALPDATLIPTTGLTRSFTYRATDPGNLSSANATVTLRFLPPTITQANPNTFAYTSINRNAQTFNVLANDQPTALGLNLGSVQVTRDVVDGVATTPVTTGQLDANASRGLVATPASGNISYTAPVTVNGVQFAGTDHFWYRVRENPAVNNGAFSNWARVDVTVNLPPVRTATSTTFGSLAAPNVVSFTAPTTSYATPNLTTTTYVVDPGPGGVLGAVNAASLRIATTNTSALGTTAVPAQCFVPEGGPGPVGASSTDYGVFSLNSGAIVFTPTRRSNYLIGNSNSLTIRCQAYFQVNDDFGAPMNQRALVNVFVRAD